MRVRILGFLAFLIFTAITSRAETNCPWLTQGSAAKVMGGDSSALVSLANEKEGTCTFSHQDGAHTYALEITVSKKEVDACPADSAKLTGIGNAAALCRTEHSPVEAVEQVSSRVRDLFFTIRLVAKGPKTNAMPIAVQREAVSQTAEQVAGNLY
jgi:hypothetical protein